MNVAQAVGESLVRLGVRTAFGVVGSGNFHVVNALTAGGTRFVAARHEGGAAVMADAYAVNVSDPAELPRVLREALAEVRGGRSAVVAAYLPGV